MSFIIQHTSLGFCWWDLVAAILLVAVIVYFAVKNRNMKQEQKDLEDELADLYADDVEESPIETVKGTQA